MNIFYKHQIDHRPHSINLYYNQPFQTGPISTNEQTSESLPTATSNDANKQLEPVVLYTHFSMDQKSDIQYVMTTALSHISFQIINPTFISFQSDPFLLHLIAPCHKTHTNSKKHPPKIILLQRITSPTTIKCLLLFSTFPAVQTHSQGRSSTISKPPLITSN